MIDLHGRERTVTAVGPLKNKISISAGKGRKHEFNDEIDVSPRADVRDIVVLCRNDGHDQSNGPGRS